MRRPPLLRIYTLAVATMALAGCGIAPPRDITLPSSSATVAISQATIGDVKIARIQWQAMKPHCKEDCPSVHVDSVTFTDMPRLTQLVDHVLAYMTGLDQGRHRPYLTLSQYAEYFWQTAQAHDATFFKATVKDVVGDIIAVELHTEQYLTGAAHGIPATQYINWQRKRGRVLALEEVLIPGREANFAAALRQAHQRWLQQNKDAQRDPVAYNRLWPFQESDNFALTHQGVVVKYDAYRIAPYSYGQPELVIPYHVLGDILQPQFLPGAAEHNQ